MHTPIMSGDTLSFCLYLLISLFHNLLSTGNKIDTAPYTGKAYQPHTNLATLEHWYCRPYRAPTNGRQLMVITRGRVLLQHPLRGVYRRRRPHPFHCLTRGADTLKHSGNATQSRAGGACVRTDSVTGRTVSLDLRSRDLLSVVDHNHHPFQVGDHLRFAQQPKHCDQC